jgi:antitoxin YefM
MKKIISNSNCNAVKETIYLEKNGVVDVVRQREKDNSGFTNVEDIDWEQL